MSIRGNLHRIETRFRNAVRCNERFFVQRWKIEMERSAQVRQADEQQGHGMPET